MFTGVSRAVRAAGRTGLRGGAVLVGAAILAGGVLASPASAATVPRPAPGFVPGATRAERHDPHLLPAGQPQPDHSVRPVGVGVGQAAEPGGELTSGPAAITINGGFENFANTWVFARGTGKAVRYRGFAGARGSWGRWTRLGARAASGAPGVTCLAGPPSSPIVFIRALTERCGNALSAATAGSRAAATSPRLRPRCRRSTGRARPDSMSSPSAPTTRSGSSLARGIASAANRPRHRQRCSCRAVRPTCSSAAPTTRCG